MVQIKKHIFIFSFLASFALTAAGCIPLMVGAAAGVGGYAWVKGALVKDFDVPALELHKATISALKDLKVDITEDKSDRLSALVNGKFADGNKIVINIEAMTERTSRIKIRVGIIGDKDRSEMIYNAIKKRI
jgi:hypothetical protein